MMGVGGEKGGRTHQWAPDKGKQSGHQSWPIASTLGGSWGSVSIESTYTDANSFTEEVKEKAGKAGGGALGIDNYLRRPGRLP